MTLDFASCQGWVEHEPELLTLGIREAYLNGLEIAVPTGADTLGWAA